MKPVPHRVVIYAKDVMHLTGRRRQNAYRLLAEIRKNCGLKKDGIVTVKQFCAFTGIEAEDVINYLREWS